MMDEGCPFVSLKQSPAVRVGHAGLFASINIEPGALLLSIQQRHTICYSNIPSAFKNQFQSIHNYKFVSRQTKIEKQIDANNQLLLLYLIHLRHTRNQSIFKEWFARPLTAMFFFDRKAIEQSQSYDLLIDYVAEHNHIKQITEVLYLLLGEAELIEVLFAKTVDLPTFTHNYVWSYHFINNRSFGYTEEYTLIPLFDMVNHSARHTNVAQLLSNQPVPSQHQVESLINKAAMSYESDNEEEITQVQTGKKAVLNHQFYYQLIATEPVAEGQQLVLQYGNRNNKFFLEGYGFVEKDNPYDSVLIYVDQTSDNIHFDSVRGQGCKSYKLKRHIFCLQFLLDMKRHFYSNYYKKDASKVKVIWSKPKDRLFQIFFLKRTLERMINNQPKKHQFSPELRGAEELYQYEQERHSIFRTNIGFFFILLSSIDHNSALQIEVSKNFYQKEDSSTQLPESLRDYLNLLKLL